MTKREMLDEVAYRMAKIKDRPTTVEGSIQYDVLDDLWVYLFTNMNKPKRCEKCKQTLPEVE